ncbi:MAG: DNA polymerase III subunit delta [Erysipelotrichaceae bacterium]
MFKERLKEEQPVVYQTLLHAILNDKLAHAYMFCGAKGTPKLETAYLLVQSLLCEQSGFACEECDDCKRVIHNNYADMIYLSGETTSIKKDDILELQHEFNKTGLESKGRKVYIIDHGENATPDAMNSLLKFLEEPTSDMIAILIVEQVDRMLPTIVSRCQIIPFVPLKSDYCYDVCLKSGMDEFNAYILSQLIKNVEVIKETSEEDDYQHACYCFKGVMDRLLIKTQNALLFLQIEGFDSKNKQRDKKVMKLLCDMMILLFKDCLNDEANCNDAWYKDKVTKIKEAHWNCCEVLSIMMQSKDMLVKSSVNLNLLMDQTFYKIKEVIE